MPRDIHASRGRNGAVDGDTKVLIAVVAKEEEEEVVGDLDDFLGGIGDIDNFLRSVYGLAGETLSIFA